MTKGIAGHRDTGLADRGRPAAAWRNASQREAQGIAQSAADRDTRPGAEGPAGRPREECQGRRVHPASRPVVAAARTAGGSSLPVGALPTSGACRLLLRGRPVIRYNARRSSTVPLRTVNPVREHSGDPHAVPRYLSHSQPLRRPRPQLGPRVSAASASRCSGACQVVARGWMRQVDRRPVPCLRSEACHRV